MVLSLVLLWPVRDNGHHYFGQLCWPPLMAQATLLISNTLPILALDFFVARNYLFHTFS